MRDSIRWFKCKLKPPKNVKRSPKAGTEDFLTCLYKDPMITFILSKRHLSTKKKQTQPFNIITVLETRKPLEFGVVRLLKWTPPHGSITVTESRFEYKYSCVRYYHLEIVSVTDKKLLKKYESWAKVLNCS